MKTSDKVLLSVMIILLSIIGLLLTYCVTQHSELEQTKKHWKESSSAYNKLLDGFAIRKRQDDSTTAALRHQLQDCSRTNNFYKPNGVIINNDFY